MRVCDFICPVPGALEGPFHIGLSGADPNLADEHVGDRKAGASKADFAESRRSIGELLHLARLTWLG